MVDGPVGRRQASPGAQRLPSTEVTGEARMRAAGDLQPHPVAAREPVGGRPKVDPDGLFGSRAAAQDAVADVSGAPGALDVAEPGEEVEVLGARRQVQLRADCSDDLQVVP